MSAVRLEKRIRWNNCSSRRGPGHEIRLWEPLALSWKGEQEGEPGLNPRMAHLSEIRRKGGISKEAEEMQLEQEDEERENVASRKP